MTTEFVRDAAATAAIFGFFGSVWFGWAQETPAVVAAMAAHRFGRVVGRPWLPAGFWSGGTGTTARCSTRTPARRSVSSSGSSSSWPESARPILGARGRKDFIPVWIALVVGVHLFPVAVITRDLR